MKQLIKYTLAFLALALLALQLIISARAAYEPHTSYAPQPQPAPVTQPTAVPVFISAPQPVAPTPAPVAVPILVAPVIQEVLLAPTRDWTPELKAVEANLQNAVDLVELCAVNKVKAAAEFRVLDCQPAIDNLETAKELIHELQEQIRKEAGR